MRVIKEQIIFLAAIGMLVAAMLFLTQQVELYQNAYAVLGSYLSHPSVMTESED